MFKSMFDGSEEGWSVSDGFQLQTALILIGVCNIVDMSTTECVFDFDIDLLSCQPRVTVTSCFVYKVIMDLYSIDHLCINPILRIGLIQK